MSDPRKAERSLNPLLSYFHNLDHEPKCFICLNLLSKSTLLPCNHILCKLMYFTEIRPAPYMDNLVAIYKNLYAVFSSTLLPMFSEGMQMADGEESPFVVGTILARDLAPDTTEDDLKRHFTRYGDITKAIIPFNKVTGKPHSFGFVTFSDPSVITVVLSKPHPINNFWAEVSRAMKGEDLQTLEYQRIYVPRHISSSHIFEGPGDSNKRSIFVSGSRLSRFTKHEVMEYFLGYGNVFSCPFICDESCGIVIFSTERTIDRVLRKSIHNLNGRCLNVWRWYGDYVHSNNISLTYGGVDRNAPKNHRVVLGSQASVASFDDQRPKGKARRPNISAPNVTINPQTRHLINFGGYWPNEAGFGSQSVVRRYELAPYNMKDTCANYHANLRHSSDEGGFGDHEIIRRYESAAPNANTNRGINLGYGSNNVVFGNHVVTRQDESAPSMTSTPHINRGIDLGSLSDNAVFGDHGVIQPASNTVISHTNRRVTPSEGVFANNQLEWERPFTLFRPILGRDVGKSSSSNDLPSQEEFEFFYSYNQN